MKKSFFNARKIFLENNGFLRLSQAKEFKIDPHTISDMVLDGLLTKEARGLYRLSDLPPLSNPDLVQISLLVPQSVVCLISALAFHQLTTQIPYQIYIAIPQDTKKPRINYPPLEVVKLTNTVYSAGIQEHILDGIPVRIYNKEKTVADCFKFRNKIGKDIAIEALKDYMHLPGSEVEKLIYYAKICRVENIMRPYMETTL